MTLEMVDRQEASKPSPVKASASGLLRGRVTHVWHWTDKLFTFQTTRDLGFRFESGQFAMIGLDVEGRPLLRAYSMASAVYDDWLKFFSIKVPNGPLTSRLQHIQIGDTVLVGRKPTGTLVLGNLRPGRIITPVCRWRTVYICQENERRTLSGARRQAFQTASYSKQNRKLHSTRSVGLAPRVCRARLS